jgi:hypothetical protein
MTASVRYKFIRNTTGVPITATNFPYQTDGDDKLYRFIRHKVTAADIGVNPGQLGHVEGMILDSIPINYNILWFQVNIFRVNNILTPAGMYTYNNVENQIINDPDSLEMTFGVAKNNCIMVQDKGNAGSSPITASDILTALVIIGPRGNPLDSMISGN